MRKSKIIYLFILIFILIQSGRAQFSEYALLQRRIFADPDVWHLTKAYANSEWGVDLYAYPKSVSQVYLIDDTNHVYTAMSFTSDYTFHRIVYSEAFTNWIRAYGSFGSSTGHFNSPSGIVAFNRPESDYYTHHVYVADTWNNRIYGFSYDWNTATIYAPYEITGGGLVLPKDLDINNGGEFGNASNDRIWVLNGDRTIKKFDLNGNLLLTYNGDGFFGSGDLIGIACGRSDQTTNPPPYERFANNNYIYVIQKSQISQFCENSPGNVQHIRSQALPQRVGWVEYFTSIEVDNFGQVWTTVIKERVDGSEQQSYICKMTEDLDFLCLFNAGGNLNHPQCFSNAGGNRGCGNVIVLEEWSNESGALYFWIGTDILNYTTGSNAEHWCHYANFTLVDPALDSVKVYNAVGTLIKNVFPPSPTMGENSGWTEHWWGGTDNSNNFVPTGYYRIEVKAASVYKNLGTGQPVNTVIKDGWVYNINYSQPLLVPTITSVQAIDTSMYIVWNDNNNNELGYIIERKDMTSGQWRVIDTTSWDIVNYTDHNQVMGSETYDYRIKAYNYFGSSGYSNTVSKRAHPRPPTNLYVQNFYCNRPYRPFKIASSEEDISTLGSPGKSDCYSPFPDSILSNASAVYANYPTNQKPGTFARIEVWSRSCHWFNHNVVRRESTFTDLSGGKLIQTRPDPPGSEQCTDFTYYFRVRTFDIYGDSSVFLPGVFDWPYACCVGSCNIPIHGYDNLNKLAIPVAFSLDQNYPNPFNPETQIKYALPQNARVKLVIFNILGERVIILVDEFQAAGYKTVRWDGRDESGREVASGIYFYDLSTDGFRNVRKMVLMK